MKYSAGDALVYEQGGNDGQYTPAKGDQIILDPNNNLAQTIRLSQHHFCPLQNVGRFLKIKFYDTNGNNRWDSGEDIVVDVNDDGDFDP
jgi:hypothetical protein